jgi:peptide/nickel transport system permease protein
LLPLILRRIAFLLAVIVAVTALTFVLLHGTGTDPAQLLAGPHATPTQILTFRHRFGLDQPLPLQYFYYLKEALHGDFGVSIHSQHAVSADLSRYLPATLELVIVAMLFAVIGGIGLGVLAAVYRDGPTDAVARLIAVSGLAVPVFLLGLVAQYVFYDQLGWLPSTGRLDMGVTPPPTVTGFYLVDSLLAGNLHLLINAAWHLLLPAVVLGFSVLASITRMTRNSLGDVLAQDYIRTARAKGLRRGTVIWRHALRNAILSTLTIIGLQFGALLGSTILVETVFAWPGIGLYLVQSVVAADYAPVLGVTTVIAALYVVINLVVDVSYLVADPRIRFR